jgi:hypothetical protein
MIAEGVQIAAGLFVAAWAGKRANHHKPGTPWLDRITISLIGAAGLLAVLGVPLSRAPVVVDAHASVIQHDPGVIRLHLTGFKPAHRAMCELLELDAYIVDANGLQLEVPMTVDGDPRIGNTRPPGLQDFGVWRLDYPPDRVASAALFTAEHRCAWWMPRTVTIQGPFNLPRP